MNRFLIIGMYEETNKWLVIVNPQASIGKSGKDWPEIKQILLSKGIDFDSFLTEYPGHAIEIVKNLITEKGYKKVIAIGGDGTNNEVINGIFTQQRFPTKEMTMGVIPVGTGNDWRRTFDIPIDYQVNVDTIKRGFSFPHDIGKVTYYNNGDPKERYFLNAAGTGLDEMVCGKTNLLKSQGKGGAARYMLSVVNCLIKYDGMHVKIEIDGNEVFDDEILSLSIGNCKYNGGGMMMMPYAVPNDGLLDMTVIKKVGMLKFAANVSNIYNGSFIHKLKEVNTFKGKKIRVTSIPPHSLLLETEGENLNNSPFDFEIIPQAINMIIPENKNLKF